MAYRFKELDDQDTPLGPINLRVRGSIALEGEDVYEVTLNGEFLMSSVINASEKALATLALAAVGERPCDVLVGGLGLGYTAQAALAFENVQRLQVVEYLAPVIDWHRRRLVPAADTLMSDPRCEIVHADFFAMVQQPTHPRDAGGPWDAILLDIDHSPDSLLHASHGRFYTGEGVRRLRDRLRPGGVFSLWSAEQPTDAFIRRLRDVFDDVASHTITFRNPMLHADDHNVVVTATRAAGSDA